MNLLNSKLLLLVKLHQTESKIYYLLLEILNLPKSFNKGLRTVESDCFAHLFYKADISDDDSAAVYIDSISGQWNEMYSIIRNALVRLEKGQYGIRCKVLHYKSPKNQVFEKASDVFKKKSFFKSLGKHIVCILVNSSKECKISISSVFFILLFFIFSGIFVL